MIALQTFLSRSARGLAGDGDEMLGVGWEAMFLPTWSHFSSDLIFYSSNRNISLRKYQNVRRTVRGLSVRRRAVGGGKQRRRTAEGEVLRVPVQWDCGSSSP